MSSNHEVLGGMYDYHYAAERKREGKDANRLRFLGRVARLFTEDDAGAKKIEDKFYQIAAAWKQKRAEAKADHDYNGSLQEISHTFERREEEPAATDPNYLQPVKSRRYGEANAYRSVHARETAEGPGSIDDEMAEIMQGAVERARQHLGELSTAAAAGEPRSELPNRVAGQSEDIFAPVEPVAAGQEDNLRYRDDPEADAALLRRLERAYNAPAYTPPHEQKTGRHRRRPRRFPMPIIRHRNDDLTSTRGN